MKKNKIRVKKYLLIDNQLLQLSLEREEKKKKKKKKKKVLGEVSNVNDSIYRTNINTRDISGRQANNVDQSSKEKRQILAFAKHFSRRIAKTNSFRTKDVN
jgi:hypothetical protein